MYCEQGFRFKQATTARITISVRHELKSLHIGMGTE